MLNDENNTWKGELDKLNWDCRDELEYRETAKEIVKIALKITKAEVGALFLTADGIFLEAAHWEKSGEMHPPPASELPTYHLQWWGEDDTNFDGITAFVAVRQKIENLNQKEVFKHPAWKGKWDAVFLEGERTKCTGILAIPIQSKIGAARNVARVHGVLKVENPGESTPLGRFKSDHEDDLKRLAEAIATELDKPHTFWREFVKARDELKVSYIVELLERGRSINYNLSQSLGYVNSLFKTWLGSDGTAHVFWDSRENPRSHVLYQWDFAAGGLPEQHTMLEPTIEYLFSWDNVPGGDSEKLLKYLKEDHDIEWAESVKPRKVNDGRTICVDKDKNSAEITIDDKGKKAIVKINGVRTPDLKVKEENDELKIYAEYMGELVAWLEANVGPKIVQRQINISEDLWKTLFPKLTTPHKNRVDVIRMKAGKYDLGAVVLPQSPHWDDMDKKKEDRKALETLTGLAMNVVSILGRFIEDEYETTVDTYLPEHRPPRVQKNCAILFADIKNFSQLVQILRLMGKPQLIEPFMDHFCARMGKIIGETPLGRVDKFLGDGVMALFGEYDPEEDYAKVVVAVNCAEKMIEQFRELYKEWVVDGITYTAIPYGGWRNEGTPDKETKSKPLKDLRKRFNEDVQIDLTIGINIGEIYFDYFGDRTHREYTAIGDNVNFTQKIRGAAGRYDESEHRVRENIVVSQTAYQFLREHGYLLEERDPFWPRFKGFGFAYPIYELKYTDLNHTKIAETIRDLEM